MQTHDSFLRRVAPWLLMLAGIGGGWAVWAAKNPGFPALALGKPAAPASTDAAQGKGGPTPGGGGGGRRGAGGGGNGPVSAGAVAASTAHVRIVQTGLGSVVSRNTVTVRSRVSGQLQRVLFKEGQFVQAGELLAEIDPRPFQVQLTQVQGQMARDQALLANTRRDVERFKALAAKGSVSAQQVDTQESLVRQYEGVVLADQGQVDNAALQLSFTKITAPLSGRIGLRLIDAGNNISASDTGGLAVINEVQPVTVVFALPEDSAPQVMQRLRAAEAGGGALPVEAWDRSNSRLLAKGSLLTIDNQIDPASGTIKLKALFQNADHALMQNQFVNARLLLETRQNATVIPTAAVQRGSAGPFVYAVKEDKTVAVRRVALGPVDGEQVAVDAGLAPGEVVIVNGADKLRDGAKVEVVMQQAGQAPTAQGRSGFANPAETFAGRKEGSANVSDGVANPVTPGHGRAGPSSPVAALAGGAEAQNPPAPPGAVGEQPGGLGAAAGHKTP